MRVLSVAIVLLASVAFALETRSHDYPSTALLNKRSGIVSQRQGLQLVGSYDRKAAQSQIRETPPRQGAEPFSQGSSRPTPAHQSTLQHDVPPGRLSDVSSSGKQLAKRSPATPGPSRSNSRASLGSRPSFTSRQQSLPALRQPSVASQRSDYSSASSAPTTPIQPPSPGQQAAPFQPAHMQTWIKGPASVRVWQGAAAQTMRKEDSEKIKVKKGEQIHREWQHESNLKMVAKTKPKGQVETLTAGQAGLSTGKVSPFSLKGKITQWAAGTEHENEQWKESYFGTSTVHAAGLESSQLFTKGRGRTKFTHSVSSNSGT